MVQQQQSTISYYSEHDNTIKSYQSLYQIDLGHALQDADNQLYETVVKPCANLPQSHHAPPSLVSASAS